MCKLLPALVATLPLLWGEAKAQSQPFKPIGPAQTWSIDAGAGAVYGFSPNGGDTDKVNPIPWVSFNYKNRVYGDPLSGVGYNLIARDRLIAGVQVRPRYGGKSDKVSGLEVPGLGVDGGAYAFYRIGEKTSVGGRIAQDISNVSRGATLFLSASRQEVTRVGMLQTTLYSRFGDKKTNQAYYGVEASEAASSGLSPYEVGAGPQSIGMAVLWVVPLHKQFMLATFVNADRALGDVAESPLLQLAPNKETSYRAGVLIIRRFGGD